MVRIGGALEILQVTTDATGICAGQVVVPVHMALRALHAGVCSGEREARAAVVKRRIVPGTRVVALLAGRRESRLHVIWIGRAIEILHVARNAVGRGSHKLTVDMALSTGHVHVPTRQRELCERIVIESRRVPRAAVVAGLTCRRETGLRMRGIVRLVEVGEVAAHAACGRGVELSARVAGTAIQVRVRSDQGEPGELQVVEFRAHPVVHRVALLAGRREVERNVIDSRGLRVREVFLVAGQAHRRQALELSDGGTGVAGIAIESGVRANQRKAI